MRIYPPPFEPNPARALAMKRWSKKKANKKYFAELREKRQIMKKLKEKVFYCLENFPETRNSDIKLTNCVWIKFYPQFLELNNKNQWQVKLLDLYELPKEDDVKRIRTRIQNKESKFLPNDPEVRKKRQIKEEEWRKYLGYNPELRQVLI